MTLFWRLYYFIFTDMFDDMTFMEVMMAEEVDYDD
jgi:hypothetical protein